MPDRRTPPSKPDAGDDNEFFDSLKKGALIGAGILVLVLPLKMVQQHRDAERRQPVPPVATAPAPQVQPQPQPQSPAEVPKMPGVRLADFGEASPSADVKLVANWAVHTRDHGANSFIVIDKKLARVWVFDPQGKLKAQSPALLGEAIGDDSAPGIGDKPLSQIKPWEKTTPAGRFVAEPGRNLSGEDVVWVSYDLAVSMHRIRKVKESERRFQRLASETHADNRISNGCINLPIPFYEKVVAPTVRTTGAVVYVIPEKGSIQKVLGAWDVTNPMQMAQKT